MIFRQLFDRDSSTYTYLLARRAGGEALIIDPVKEQLDQYLTLIRELDLKLVKAIDTHTHADHVTALGDLREHTGCMTMMGEYTKAECVSMHVGEGDIVDVDGVKLRALYTPGHTDESFSFVLDPDRPQAVFTGDVLLIRGTGRTDFQNGDPEKSWDSIVNKLFWLPDETLVYPAHDYKGWTVSSIGEEKRHNPRLAGRTRAQYVEIMRNLRLPDPKQMDVAVPANLACGQDRAA
jgi:sulfur dioxygenase